MGLGTTPPTMLRVIVGWIVHCFIPRADLILNIPTGVRQFTLVEVVSSNKASSLPWDIVSNQLTRAVGLRHPATHLHHWRLPPYPHPACRHERWLRLVCLRHCASCPSTVAAGDGASLSLSGNMANFWPYLGKEGKRRQAK